MKILFKNLRNSQNTERNILMILIINQKIYIFHETLPVFFIFLV